MSSVLQYRESESFHQMIRFHVFSARIVKGRGIKSVIVVLDFENMQTNQDGKEIRSIRMVQNYDCAGKRIGSRGYKLRDNVARERGFEGESNNIVAENTKGHLMKTVEKSLWKIGRLWLKSSLFIWAALPIIHLTFLISTGNLGTNPRNSLSATLGRVL